MPPQEQLEKAYQMEAPKNMYIINFNVVNRKMQQNFK